MAQFGLVLIIIGFLIIIWMLMMMHAKTKGLVALALDDPFLVFFVVIGTLLVIILVIIPLIQQGYAELIVNGYLNKPVKI